MEQEVVMHTEQPEATTEASDALDAPAAVEKAKPARKSRFAKTA